MLDPSKSIPVDEDLGCEVYGDDRDPYGFYVIPKVPAIARADDGRPELELTVYGKKSGNDFAATGSLLTLTTELRVAEETLAKVTDLLRQRIADAWPEDSAEPPPQPKLFATDWLDGTVRVTLVPGATSTATPSFMGTNRCSFSLSFDAKQTEALQKAWTEGLPDATIAYEGHVRTGSQATTTTVVTKTVSISIDTDEGAEGAEWEHVGANVEGGGGATGPLAVEAVAPLAGSAPDLDAAQTTIAL